MEDKPAFPIFPETGAGHSAAFQGLTRREMFAAMAMQGMLAEGSFHPDAGDGLDPRYAVRCADALIAELDREDST